MSPAQPMFLEALSPEEIDQVWSPFMKAVQHAEEAVEFYEAQLDQGAAVSLESLQRAKEHLLAQQTAEVPFREEFIRRGGWIQVWLAGDGTMHADRGCAGEYAYILPYLSGKDYSEIAERVGTQACIECFRGIRDLPEYRRAVAREQAALECPGSRRKAQEDACPVCGGQPGVTAKGRVKVHQAKLESLI